MKTIASLLATAILVAPVQGQLEGTDWVRLTEAEEIALARSAAPPEVSAEATIWVLRDGRFQVGAEGSSGNACVVQRSQPLSLEPICYDREAAATVLLWEFEHFALRTSGLSPADVEQALAEGVAAGRIPSPRRPAMAYMMSSGQRLYDPESGRAAGNWHPHVMYYVPNLTAADIGLAESLPSLQVAYPGTAMAHLIVVTPDFVHPGHP
jgi:hypothetical protein